jgi:hypothetical protein
MVVNTIASAGIGIMIFFHVFFFIAIIGFIYGATGGRSRIVIDILAYTCVTSLFLPILYVIRMTFLEEIEDFKKARELEKGCKIYTFGNVTMAVNLFQKK